LRCVLSTSEPHILSFDTSAAHCAAALLWGDSILAQRHEPMAKGQAERLMPLIEAVLAEGGQPLDGIDAIAVGVGPGNFTGIRIGVSAARGLALALNVPAIGVTGFEAMRGASAMNGHARQLVSLPGPRDGYYLQPFQGGQTMGPAHAAPNLDGVDWTAMGVTGATEIIGHNADLISGFLSGAPEERHGHVTSTLPTTELAATIGRIALAKLTRGAAIARPTPVYVRPADAAPAREKGPTILPC
jgi:tRNA threonylcarbamoyladenosine biosynthesis protein TsaB